VIDEEAVITGHARVSPQDLRQTLRWLKQSGRLAPLRCRSCRAL
jgi:hypothetical protein